MDFYSRENGNMIQSARSLSSAMTKVYSWMFLGLLITAFSAFSVLTIKPLQKIIFANPFMVFVLIIAEFALVWYLSARAMNMSYSSASAAFIIYSVLNGLTLSSIFFVYSGVSIFMAFIIAAAFFGTMSLYGLATKSDLSSLGSLLFAGLIGLIIASLINVFLNSDAFSLVISFIGVAIFLALTAYDSQKIKSIHAHYAGTPLEKNVAIVGALILYLDFINIFLFILRILGRRD